MVQWIVNIHAKWLLSCTLFTNRMSLRILSMHILFWHFSYLTFLRILAHCVSRSRAWAYEYMRKSKWDIHTWEFHPSSPAGMQHCSRRTGKILMEKKSRISCGNYIVQFSSKSEGLGRFGHGFIMFCQMMFVHPKVVF